MTKADLVSKIAAQAGISKAKAEKTLLGLIELIESQLKAGQKVTFTGFGTFEIMKRAARIGRNPRTGKEIKIAASNAPKFKVGKQLKEAVAK